MYFNGSHCSLDDNNDTPVGANSENVPEVVKRYLFLYETACSALRDTVSYNGMLLFNAAKDDSKIARTWSKRSDTNRDILSAKKASTTAMTVVKREAVEMPMLNIVTKISKKLNGCNIDFNILPAEFVRMDKRLQMM